MKALLLSPFKSHNYGTVLQAFALFRIVSSLGIDCEYLRWYLFNPSFKSRLSFIAKHPRFLWHYYKYKKKIKNDLKYDYLSTESYRDVVKKNNFFSESFIRYSSHEYSFDEFNKIENNYDIIIVGSDQTWSPNVLYQYTPYYLEYIHDNAKKNAYAPSIGTTSVSDSFLSFLKIKLKTFNHLSCRDNVNCTILSDKLGRNVQNVVDPTMLMTGIEWKDYMVQVNGMPSKYIICYVLGEKECIYHYALKLGTKTGLPVYYIQTRPNNIDGIKPLKGIGCQEFLWLIANCQYLVTDSFHGTIFSVNFNRNFVSFNKHIGGLDNGRIKDILSAFKIENHFHLDDDESIPETIDYTQVNKILDEKRKQSLSYIKAIFCSE